MSSASLSSLVDWDRLGVNPAAKPMPYAAAIFLLFVLVISFTSSQSNLKSVPIVNSDPSFFSNVAARQRFVTSAKDIMKKARELYNKQPFRVQSDLGVVLMLPPQFADEIRNESNLSFGAAHAQDSHTHLPGFGAAAQGQEMEVAGIVAKKQLTQHLSKMTQPLSKEVAHALSVNFGESADWTELRIKPAVQDIVARLSSCVFLGDQLCRNEDWLRITKEYAGIYFFACSQLRVWPKPLRPLVHWFLPRCRTLRAQLAASQKVIAPVVQQRSEAKRAALASGQPVPEFNDALEWVEQEASARGLSHVDPAICQLGLSLAAIHTTTDLYQQIILDLARNPEFAQPLREEIVAALRVHGWQKTALANMKLLDSAIKESLRLKPSSIASMRRMVVGDFTLSNGIALKTGDRLGVDSRNMWDPEIYEDPYQYNPYRFLQMRSQSGKEKDAYLTTTGANHFGFGHGNHACPGRFFAANELKIATCHILLKYDWELIPETNTEPIMNGLMSNSNPTARIRIRRRRDMELDIDDI